MVTRTLASLGRSSSATPMPTTPTRDSTTPRTWFTATRSTSRIRPAGRSRTPSTSAARRVNNFRFGHLTANAPQGGPQITVGCGFALGSERNLHSTFSALQQTWPNVAFNSAVRQRRRIGQLLHRIRRSDLGICRLIHDGSRQAHAWVRRRLSALAADPQPRRRLLRRLDTSTGNDPDEQCRLYHATGLCGTGNAVADMLLGYYGNVGGFVPGPLSPTNTAGNPQDHVFSYFGPYVMDDWKVTPEADSERRSPLGFSSRLHTKRRTTSSGWTTRTRKVGFATLIRSSRRTELHQV